jgi:HlyD family secretion protein
MWIVIAILRRVVILGVVAAGVWAVYRYTSQPPTEIVLTGIVTTDEIVVSPQIGGRIERLLVKEGDEVMRDQLLAVLVSDELKDERDYYRFSAEGLGSQVTESEAALRREERLTADQIRQAQANMASTESQQAAAQAELSNAKVALDRAQRMLKEGIGTQEQLERASTAHDVARAQLASLGKQIEAQRAAVALAETNAEQVAVRKSQVLSNRRQQSAATAQRAKADVRLGYTELHAPISGIVDVRVAHPGEVVQQGQPVVTLVDPDNLWVRADVEESYIDKIKQGDTLSVRLPSGDERQGTVFYRRVDAGFATQRDVSRTKRDIKTFEIRLRVDNRDRHLAVGMTTYVRVPVL